MTILRFTNGGSSARNLEVSIHWSGFLSGYTKLQTDADGCVTVDDALLNGKERTAETIYVENPNGGYKLKFEGVKVKKGDNPEFTLEIAKRQ